MAQARARARLMGGGRAIRGARGFRAARGLRAPGARVRAFRGARLF
jgi:hypothetical protein